VAVPVHPLPVESGTLGGVPVVSNFHTTVCADKAQGSRSAAARNSKEVLRIEVSELFIE
jgi:hypothetical protein